MARRGITRGEVLVVLAVAAVALCAGLVWLQGAREASRRVACTENLRLLAQGLAQYAQREKAYPYGTVQNAALPPERRLSWCVGAWEFALGNFRPVDEGPADDDGIRREFVPAGPLVIDLQKPWDAAENLPPRIQVRDPSGQERPLLAMPRLHCPANRLMIDPSLPRPTSYVGIGGLGSDAPAMPLADAQAGIFGYDRQTPRANVAGRGETTLLLAETGFENGPWTAGGPPTVRGVDTRQEPCLGVGRSLGGLHPKGANAACADGRVEFLHESIDRQVLAALVALAGGP